MAEYRVTWSIDVDADSPREAAEEARRSQVNPDTTAIVFEVAASRGALIETIDLAAAPDTDRKD